MTQATKGGRRRGRLLAASVVAAAATLVGMGVTPSTSGAALAAAPTTVVRWMDQQTPTSVGGIGGTGVLSGVRSLATSDSALTVMGDTSVMAWGPNNVGQLGDGTTTNRPFPVPVHGVGAAPVLTNVSGASTRNGHSLAVLRDSSVVAWGLDDQGQLGDRSNTRKLTAVPVHGVGTAPRLTGVTAVAAGDEFSVALLADGSMVAWGYNSDGALGNGTYNGSSSPVPVTGLPGPIVAISAGGRHVLALTAAGEVVAWGNDDFGQLGNGAASAPGPELLVAKPTPVAGLLSGVTAISAGANFSLAIRADGSVVGWGYNHEDELGDNTTHFGACSCYPVPDPVHTPLGRYRAVSAGDYHALALRDDGAVISWGVGNSRSSGLCYCFPVSDPVSAPGALGAAGSGATEIAAGYGFFLACIECDPTAPPPLPTISGITPQCGPEVGGTPITIMGTHLGEASGVTVGGASTSFTVKADGTAINLLSPRHSPGPAVLAVITPAGSLPAGTFSYPCIGRPPPTTTVNPPDPPCGPTAGGTNVHITGANLGSTAQVTFTGVASAINVPVIASGTALVVLSPPSAAGTVPVVVTTAAGPFTAGSFTYPCPAGFGPSLAGIRPACGPTSGGPVSLTGSHLEDRMTASFGGSSVPGTADFARTTISARAPRHAAGKVPVTLSSSTWPPTAPVTYEYSDSCETLAVLAAHQRLTAASVPTGNSVGPATTQGQAQQQSQAQAQSQTQAQVQSAAQVQPAMMTERQRELELQTEGIGRDAGGQSWMAASHREAGPVPSLAIPTAALVLLGMCLGLSRRRETVPAWLARERSS